DDIRIRQSATFGSCLDRIVADERGERGDHPFFRYSDEDDRLAMVNEPQAGDRSLGIDADDDMDRLARVADGISVIGVEECMPDHFPSAVDGCDRGPPLGWAEAVGTRHNVRGR